MLMLMLFGLSDFPYRCHLTCGKILDDEEEIQEPAQCDFVECCCHF